MKQYIKNSKNEVAQKNDYTIEQLQEKMKYPFQNLDDEPLEGEEWLPYPYLDKVLSNFKSDDYKCQKYFEIDEMLVSNKGRIKINGKIEPQKDDFGGGFLILPEYPSFGQVYRLVADTWLDGKSANLFLHHINNLVYDNSVENLIYVTPEEHYEIHHASNIKLD